MPQKDDGWVVWILIGGAALAGYYYFNGEEPVKTQKPASYQQIIESPPQVEPITTAPVQNPAPVFQPDHRYDATEDRVYFYLGAASDEERKRGVATGPTMAFRYYGEDKQGEHVFRSYTANGYPIQFYYCKDPCKLMRDESGVRTVVNDETIMGALVEDMRNGFLKKSNRQNPIQTAEPPAPVVDEIIPAEQTAED